MTAFARLRETATAALAAASERPVLGTAFVRAFGLAKIPLLFFLRPRVQSVSESRCEIVIPLTRRTKNHLGVMYIGALVGGADLAGGLMAMRRIQNSGEDVHLLFKDLHADFLKRVEGDAHFVCEEGSAIGDAVARAVGTGERVNLPMHITATVPTELGDEPVARFVLTLTLKRR